MADGKIDKLSIEIGASSKGASTKIDKLVESMKALREVMKGDNGSTAEKLSKFADAMNKLRDASKIRLNDKLPGQLKAIADAVDSISSSSIQRLDSMTRALNRLRGIDLRGFSNAMKSMKGATAQSAALQVVKNGGLATTNGLSTNANASDAEIASIFKAYRESGTGKKGLLGDFQRIANGAAKARPELQAIAKILGTAAKNAASMAKELLSVAGGKLKSAWSGSAFKGIEQGFKNISKVIGSFGRIAFYRVVRSAIKFITDAFKEGAENAYWFSREFGDATSYIADALDRISSSNFKMKNQLGAAWNTMLTTIEPIIIQIINLVTRAADAITQLFALLSGKGTYLKAVDYNKQWADSASGAAKAAKEWKNQLMSFDEINRLEEPSSGSGGGGSTTPDYGNMFEEAPVSKFFDDIKNAFESGAWAQLGTMMGKKVNEIINAVDWNGLGVKFGKGLQAIISTAYSFLRTVDFVNIGTSISEFINGALRNVNFYEAGRLWMRFRTMLWDVIYGAVISLNWHDVAVSLINFFIGALEEFSRWVSSLDPSRVALAIKDFFNGLKEKKEEIGASVKKALKAAFEFALSLTEELFPDGVVPTVVKAIVNLFERVMAALKDEDFQVAHNIMMFKLDKALFGEKWAKFHWSQGDYAGKEIIMGMIDGTESKTSELSTTLHTNINEPIDGTFQSCKDSYEEFERGYGGFADDIKTDSVNIGNDIWNMSNDVSSGFSNLDANISTSSWSICSWLQSVRDWAAETWSWLTALSQVGSYSLDIGDGRTFKYNPNKGGVFASGGFPEDGIFFANSGELVGGFSNGKTAVANNAEITAGIADAVYDAFMTAFSQTGGSNSQPVNIYLDGKVIAQSTTKYQNQYARAVAR